MMPSAIASLAGAPKTDPDLTNTIPAAAAADAWTNSRLFMAGLLTRVNVLSLSPSGPSLEHPSHRAVGSMIDARRVPPRRHPGLRSGGAAPPRSRPRRPAAGGHGAH